MSRLNLWACLKRQCVAGALLQKPVFTVQITLQNKQPLISLAEVRERPRRSRCFRVEGGADTSVCLSVCMYAAVTGGIMAWLGGRWVAKTTSLTEKSRRAGRRDCGWNSWWCSVHWGWRWGGGDTDGTGLMSKACFCFLSFLFWSELLSCFVLVHLHSGLSGGWSEWRSFCVGGKSKTTNFLFSMCFFFFFGEIWKDLKSNLGAKGTNEQTFHVVQHIVYASISKLFSDSLEEQRSHD